MTLQLRPYRRQLIARRVPRLNLAAALESLDHQHLSTGDFVHTHTPIPASETTRIAALTDGKRLLIAILVSHIWATYEKNDRLKVFFDPYNDALGFINIDIPVAGEPHNILHHLPYPQARSTRFKLPRPIKKEWHDRFSCALYSNSVPSGSERILLLTFNAQDIFRAGLVCGFNVARTRGRTGEESSWNLATGNRFFDAATFGALHLTPPDITADLTCQTTGRQFVFSLSQPTTHPLTLELADPLDNRITLKPTAHNHWSLDAASLRHAGCHRIYLSHPHLRIAPSAWSFTWSPPRAKPASFTVGMYHDCPDDLARVTPYTPQNLHALLAQQKSWGIRRFHWIDYAGPEHAELFWRNLSDYAIVTKSYDNCGDLLASAAATCRDLKIPIYGTLKPFEGWRSTISHAPNPQDALMTAADGSVFCCLLPTVPANQASAVRANPAWLTPPALPVQSLRLVSESLIPALKPSDLTLLVSHDNKTWRRYSGPLKLRVARESHPHARWSPAGPLPDSGKRTCWVIHLEGLRLRHKFLAISWQREDLRLTGRAFALAQATDANTRPVNLTLARHGSVKDGFNFYTPRRAWNNHSEPIIDWLDIGPGALGLMLAPLDCLPAILEPADPQTHQAWLTDIQSHIDRGVTGVDLRFLCHHVDFQDWGAIAFHPAVVDAFRSAFHRDPDPTEEDLHQVRLIRGQGITCFMRKARDLTRKHNIKLAIHLEAGMDVPPHLHTRNQIHMDWRAWLQENLVDEVMLKYFSSQHPFVHEQVLPLARRQGIPVHVCDLINSIFGPAGVERARRLACEARAAGLSGLSFYETAGYQFLNHHHQPTPVGHSHLAIAAAAAAAKEILP